MNNRVIAALVGLVLVIAGSYIIYSRIVITNPPELQIAGDQAGEQAGEQVGAQVGAQVGEQIEEDVPGQPDTEPQQQSEADVNTETEQEFQFTMSPDFAFIDAVGNEVKLSDLFGKPIVLNFWASWCPPCIEEMPHFEKLYQEVGDEVQFVMLNATDGQRETKEDAENFISENGFTFPVFFDTQLEGIITYGIRYFPTTVFLDKDGHIITGIESQLSEEGLREGIRIITEGVYQ